MTEIKQGFTPANTLTLSLLTLAFIVGEISHFTIGSVSKDMAEDIEFGKQKCYLNETISDQYTDVDTEFTCGADKYDSEESCNAAVNPDWDLTVNPCFWEYSGQGIEYQILAGPVFVVIFTIAGIFMGILGDLVSRTKLMAVCILLFSVCGTCMAFATEYWHLVILRMGVAAGEAACRPVGGSLIAELFDPSTRGVANGIFSWGVYIGYGFTYVLGNYIPPLDLGGYGWRSVFIIGCVWGIPVAIALFFYPDPRDVQKKLKEQEPEKIITEKAPESEKVMTDNEAPTGKAYWVAVLKAFLQPSMLLLFLAAAVRHTAGYAWSYNTQLYLEDQFGEDPEGKYHEELWGIWIALCSIIGGSFGVFFGGYFSDLLVKKTGLHSRLWILTVCLLIACPLAAGVLSVDPLECFYFLMAYYFFSETWFAILFTVIVEIVPANIRSVCIGIFLFFMNNIGGNMPVLIEPVTESLGYRTALYIFFPGCVGLSAILFFVASMPLFFEHRAKHSKEARVRVTSYQNKA